MMPKKIIFVDDSETILLSVKIATEELVNSGIIKIETYNNPLEFLDHIKNGKDYDLLVTDINMPQMSGFELSRNIRKLGEKQPILALTTENTPDMKIKGKKAGIGGWIVKPFCEDNIIVAIKRILRIR